MIRNQRTITFNVFISFGLLTFVLSLLYLRWFLRYSFAKHLILNNLTTIFPGKICCYKTFTLKRVNRGCIGATNTYVHLTYKIKQIPSTKQPFSRTSDPFSIKPTVAWIKISVKNFINFCPVENLFSKGWQTEWNFFCCKKTT